MTNTGGICSLEKLMFRGREVQITCGRITNRTENLYYYEFRHGDSDTPITLEKHVVVNFCGTLASKKPIKLNNGSITLTKREVEKLRYIL